MDHRNAHRVFLFDVDGTLIDAGGAGGGALLQALQDEFSVADPRAVALHGRTDTGIMRELLESNDVEATPTNLERLCSRYFSRLPESLRSRSGSVLPGVKDLLDNLHQDPRCTLAVLTGNMPTSAQAKLAHYDLHSFFEFGIYGDLAAERIALAKPARERVQIHLQSPIDAHQVIIVGDTILDVELAIEMGARCLAVTTGGASRSELESAGACLVLDSLTNIQQILNWVFLDTSAAAQQPND